MNERDQHEAWLRHCDAIVDRPRRKGPLLVIRLRPGDVDTLLWFSFAFLAVIEAATWFL